ncbi:MAG: flagellar biosynthesis protein FlhA, partial [Rhizobium sp.]|nr:flagellar biosynthesis protein FlhA [Rhizobium sp.]
GRAERDPLELTEKVRQALSTAICNGLKGQNAQLSVLSLDPRLENRIIAGAGTAEAAALGMEPPPCRTIAARPCPTGGRHDAAGQGAGAALRRADPADFAVAGPEIHVERAVRDDPQFTGELTVGANPGPVHRQHADDRSSAAVGLAVAKLEAVRLALDRPHRGDGRMPVGKPAGWPGQVPQFFRLAVQPSPHRDRSGAERRGHQQPEETEIDAEQDEG